jgi:hypothetical protein
VQRFRAGQWSPAPSVRVRTAVVALTGAIVSLLLASGRIRSQEPGGASPSLPGASKRLPAGIATSAPFDVAKFLAVPPPNRNAAPLYLDALSEFGAEVSVCFPEGPDRDRRSQTARDRMKRYVEISTALDKNPSSVSSASIDEVTSLYAVGFRKLAATQRRDACVFETGFGVATLLPHIQGARQLVRVTALRVRRAVERGDFDAALKDIETVLPLTRDLRPRGAPIAQLVSATFTQVVGIQMIHPILAAPTVRVTHCERLIRILSEHESESIDSYVEGLRAEYLLNRVSVLDLIQNPKEFASALGGASIKPGESVIKAFLNLSSVPGSDVGLPADTDAILARTTAKEISRVVEQWNAEYRSLAALDGLPFAPRIQRITALKPGDGGEVLSRVLRAMKPDWSSFTQSVGRAIATVRAWECWASLRRWQLTYRGRRPRDLATATKAAGLKSVPVDPYDGNPMRMATVGGRLVIYSVGKDGRDDGGEKDSKYDTQPSGDLIYLLESNEGQR